MPDHGEALTKTYKRMHDSAETASDIAELRAIHVEVDHMVAKAYDWTGIILDHGFNKTRHGVRYTVSPGRAAGESGPAAAAQLRPVRRGSQQGAAQEAEPGGPARAAAQPSNDTESDTLF